ncbi:MAG: 23S rRNA (uracil(1939)-C(5))-methyltransferase RlmD [Actinobacteria bacterium]|nr:23S rRNA (uracil(1939)-C(5))-methyltransferase RlmD [Actinomycetota bacterium]
MADRPSRGDVADVVIESLANGGRGVARIDGYVVFVDRALPGDNVRIRLRSARRRHGEADVVELLAPGADRVEPTCPHVGLCGGCRWQTYAYPAQLVEKAQLVRDAIGRIAHLPDVPVEPIVGAEDNLEYRNKVELTFTETEDGPALGFHRAGRWDQVLEVERCFLINEPANAAKDAIQRWARTTDLVAYDQRLHEGDLRNLVIRHSKRTGEVLLALVTTDIDLPRPGNLVDELIESVPGFVGLMHTRNSGQSETTYGHPTKLLHGQDFYREEILGLTLHVPWNGFLQTNTDMCEKLYGIAIEEARLTGSEVVWDLYSGIGSIGLALARDAGRVVGIEIVPEAVEQATQNAQRNGIDNAEFIAGDVQKAIEPLVEAGAPMPDLVVIDPPRAGLTPKAVKRVLELGAKTIVYVSCNPTTLAGNAILMTEGGYDLEIVRPVDMFPHTPHVECVARFVKRDQ